MDSDSENEKSKQKFNKGNNTKVQNQFLKIVLNILINYKKDKPFF